MAESVKYDLSEKEENELLEFPTKKLLVCGLADEEMVDVNEETVKLPPKEAPSTSAKVNSTGAEIGNAEEKQTEKKKKETEEERARKKKGKKRKKTRRKGTD